MVQERVKQDKKYTWNLESLYKTEGDWERALGILVEKKQGGWKEIIDYRGQVATNARKLKNLLDSYFKHAQELDQIYTYSHLRHDEDVANDLFKNSHQRAVALIHEFNNASSWIEPEILQMDEMSLKELIRSDELKEYRFFLTRLLHQKKHVLSSDKEELMAQSMRIQASPRSAFSALSNADLKFPDVLDSKKEKHTLTQGSYQVLLKSEDRTLRENAFKAIQGQFSSFKNTICELIQGQVQAHVFNQRVRGYTSSLESALKPNQIPLQVYHELISETREHLDAMHEYIALRKEVLKLEEIQYWDLSVSMIPEYKLKFSYEEACDIVVNSVAILGEEYGKILRKGITEDRWIDVYENKGKRTGAYSSGCYDSMPYILLNFQGTLNDLLTLSHEAGHSMNSLLSNRKQPYHEAQYPIFIAEVASTFHEQLTYEYLLNRAKTREERLYILNQQIDGIRATFFRQTMFAEFELKIHELAENNVPLTPALLEEEYLKLNQAYFGPNLVIDELLKVEFLRIPHFYYNFYVYQYATGIAAANMLVQKVKKEGPSEYLDFLSSGGSDYPISILRKVGVDMCQKEAVSTMIATFRSLVKKLRNELSKNADSA